MSTANRPFQIWPNMAPACTEDVRFLLNHHEDWVHQCKNSRRPKGRPLKMWPDGRVRIEFGGNFKSAAAARKVVEQGLAELETSS